MNIRPLAAPFLLIVLVVASCWSHGCSIPNLEEPECDQARDVVREFYSIHFGNEQAFSDDAVERLAEYLTPRFLESLRSTQSEVDPFTLTSDTPKAFRAGECRVIEPSKRVSFELLLFWKTDTRTEQQPIQVDAENQNGTWLVDNVQNPSTILNVR